MPTYDYECGACGHAFERWQEMSARKLRTCPKCRKRRLVRLVGAGAGVIFRGSGFYETDYKRSSSPPPKHESTSESSSGAGKTSAGSKTEGSTSESPKASSNGKSKDGSKE